MNDSLQNMNENLEELLIWQQLMVHHEFLPRSIKLALIVTCFFEGHDYSRKVGEKYYCVKCLKYKPNI